MLVIVERMALMYWLLWAIALIFLWTKNNQAEKMSQEQIRGTRLKEVQANESIHKPLLNCAVVFEHNGSCFISIYCVLHVPRRPQMVLFIHGHVFNCISCGHFSGQLQ